MPKGTYSRDTYQLEQVKPRLFHLLHDFAYTDSRGGDHPISCAELNVKGTDLASVPTFLWWYVGSYGRQTPAALIHDAQVRRTPTPSFDRREADWVFRDGLKTMEVPMLRRGLMWTAVSLETTFVTRFNSTRAKVFLLVVHALAFVAAAIWWAADGRHWTEAAVAIAMLGSLGLSLKRAGASLLLDHVALIAGLCIYWLVGEQTSWELALFLAGLLSLGVWGRRAPWIVFGLATIGLPAAVVLAVTLLMGALEWVVACLVNALKFLWSLRPGGSSPDYERPKDVLEPTINLGADLPG